MQAREEETRYNRLAGEKSPYLLQHATNPVDWYPWGEEAFEKARREDKPLFVSIGYSTCHWCHVMERESFEDLQVARLLNELFVPVKVDREERPDIDAVYVSAAQMLSGGAGWPLNIFLTPEGKPFYAVTYVPKARRFGRMGLLEMLPEIDRLWRVDREALMRDAEEVTEALRQTPAVGEMPGPDVFDHAFSQLVRLYDDENGGFGSAPKFPVAEYLFFLLAYWRRTGNERALQMTRATLDAMRAGGMYDPIGFGFFRYSTDARWIVPHFEKMLYVQALLSMAYLDGYEATGGASYAVTAREVFNYVERDLTGEGGGFLSAQDADTGCGEGCFYLWTPRQLERALGPADASLAAKVFNIFNTERRTAEAERGTVPRIGRPLAQVAQEIGMDETELRERVQGLRQRLFAARQKRPRPATDDKVLSDWNGLMIAAFARASKVLADPHLSLVAESAAQFVLGCLRSEEGRLLHRYRDGESAVAGQLDDYAFFTWGLIELYEATSDPQYLDVAVEMSVQLAEHFWDASSGGFFLTADDAEPLIARLKDAYDSALPSGNSVAMLNLLRLGGLTGKDELRTRAFATARAFSEDVIPSPVGHTQMLVALDLALRSEEAA